MVAQRERKLDDWSSCGRLPVERRTAMAEHQWRYRAYLLRVWWTSGAKQRVVRASLEDPQTGERRGFGSLEHLIAFLTTQTDTAGHRPDGIQGGMDEL